MKILFFITDMKAGGAQRVVSVLSDSFIKKGNEVSIVTIDNCNEKAYVLNDKVNLLSLKNYFAHKTTIKEIINQIIYKIKYRVFVKDREEIQQKRYYSKKAELLYKHLKENEYDIIYGFLVEANIVLGMTANKTRAKIIMAERNFPEKPNYTPYFKQLRGDCYKKADICVFQTEEQTRFFPKVVRDKSKVIFNPIKESLPAPFSEERKKIIVNYCGFREQKNIPVLIKAFAIVSEKHQEYQLNIFGDGGLKDELQNLINSLGLIDKTELLPFDPNIHERIKDYSMFVMTSDYEGMPNSLLEAMAMGLPCISTDCDGGGARAVIENGVNGILVPKGDVDAVANAMEYLIENPEKAEEMAKNAVKIREKLSVDKIAEEWLKLVK